MTMFTHLAAIGSRLLKIYRSIVVYMALISGLLTLLMSILTTFDILGRETIKKGIIGCFELSQYIMIIVIFFAVAYLESEKGNVRVEILSTHLTERWQTALTLFGSIIGLIAFCIMLYCTGIFGWTSFLIREGMHGMTGPLYVFKLAIPLGCFFMFIELLIGMGVQIKRLAMRST